MLTHIRVAINDTRTRLRRLRDDERGSITDTVLVISLLGNRISPAHAASTADRAAPPNPAASAPLVPGTLIPPATPHPPPANPPTVAIVRPPTDGTHDSLWRIAERELGDGAQWPQIWQRNRGHIQADGQLFTDPDRIRPGWTLHLPPSPQSEPVQAAPENPHPGQPAIPTPTPIPTPQTTTATPAVPTTTAPGIPAPQPANERVPHPATGITMDTGVYVGLAFAALTTAALVTVRFQRRRRYRPGSSVRDEHTIAPVVRSLRIAYDLATLPHNDNGELAAPELQPPSDTASAAALRRRATATATALLPTDNSTIIGLRDGTTVALDLARTRGLGLTGPGAATAARALAVSLLAAHQHRDTIVVIPAPDLPALLGEDLLPERRPNRLRVTDNLDNALDLLETETQARATTNATGPPRPDLVLIATPAPHAQPRLHTIIDTGSAFGLAAVLIGQWPPGHTTQVRADGTIVNTIPTLPTIPNGTRLFTLPAADTNDLVNLLAEADHPSDRRLADVAPPRVHIDIPTTPPATLHPPHKPIDRTETERSPAETARELREPAPLELVLLGRPHLHHHPDGKADLIDTIAPKQREVLVYLALHPGGVRRETLTAAIWPDAHRPYNSFHATLSQLRRTLRTHAGDTLDDLIVNTDGHYSLNRTLVSVDLWKLQDALRLTPKNLNESQRQNALRAITDIHPGGELGDGLTGAWLDAPRENLRRDVLDILGALAAGLLPGQRAEKLAALEQIRAMDPYNEVVYQDIIHTQAEAGHRQAIPRTLALLATALAEIDEKPSADIIALGQRLQQTQQSPAAEGTRSDGRRDPRRAHSPTNGLSRQ